MKTIKKTLFILLLSSITPCNSDSHKIYLTELQERQKQEQIFEFPQYTTEKYIYNKKIEPASKLLYLFGSQIDGTSTTDSTYTHILNNGITRTKITRETINGKTLYIIENWISRNPSYATLTNTAIIISTAALMGSMYVIAALSNKDHIKHNDYHRIIYNMTGYYHPEYAQTTNEGHAKYKEGKLRDYWIEQKYQMFKTTN